MSTLIRDTEKQTIRYWTEDGIPDLYLGLGMIIYGALTWWSARSGTDWAELIKTVFLLALVFAGRFVMEAIKMRLTYPRTGYVAYPQPPRQELALRFLIGMFVASALALVMTYVFFTRGVSTGLRLVNLLLPLGFGLIMANIAYQQGSLRFGIYALVAVLSGFTAIPLAWTLSPVDGGAVLNGVAMFVATGSVMLIGGTLTLVRYLSHHPLPKEGES